MSSELRAELVRLRAYLKLFRIILLVWLGVPQKWLTLSVTTEESDVLSQLGAENGWRALIVALQTTEVEDANSTTKSMSGMR